jgi:hypothetical protein
MERGRYVGLVRETKSEEQDEAHDHRTFGSVSYSFDHRGSGPGGSQTKRLVTTRDPRRAAQVPRDIRRATGAGAWLEVGSPALLNTLLVGPLVRLPERSPAALAVRPSPSRAQVLLFLRSGLGR